MAWPFTHWSLYMKLLLNFFFLYSRVNTWDGHVIWQIQTLITCISRCEQSFLYTYPSSLRILLLLRMFPFLLLSSSAASFILRFFHNNGLHFSLRHWCESDCCCDLKLRSLALCLMHKGVEYFTFSFRFIWKKKKNLSLFCDRAEHVLSF